MEEKEKCPNCNLLIDSDMDHCPYCGFDVKKYKEEQKALKEKEVIEKPAEEKSVISHKNFWNFKSVYNDVSVNLELTYFLIVFIGLDIFAVALQSITNIINPYFLNTVTGSAMVNFVIYFSLLSAILVLSVNNLGKLFSKFKKANTYLYGISYGLLVILLTSLYSYIVSFLPTNVTSNVNESSIDSIIAVFPILSIIVFGLIGPICEEFAYRLGLFSLIRRKSRLAAYIIVSLVFGLIHFDFNSVTDSSLFLNEIINLPAYILSGLLFTYAYDKEGIETSCVAHITNNLIAIASTIFQLFLS
ncbi:MAG: CPBP family glutamic-type intramembrane protease [Bacilli bacterium]